MKQYNSALIGRLEINLVLRHKGLGKRLLGSDAESSFAVFQFVGVVRSIFAFDRNPSFLAP